jgi:hypothetical protein
MSEKEELALADAWARWKKRVAEGWGPVFAWIAKDIEPPPKPPEPTLSNTTRGQRAVIEKK